MSTEFNPKNVENTTEGIFNNEGGLNNPDGERQPTEGNDPNGQQQEGGFGGLGDLSGKANEAVDGLQEQHSDKLGGFGDKANEMIDGAQEKFGNN
ncbi:hypothetical protein ACQQCD_07155 [Pseudarthrobacter sp. J1763]|uniref:hypothetical protein n=1 Tax=Pseudarthrobacter sp. J1763 TaxID=3420445 RepID=UPI003D2D828F